MKKHVSVTADVYCTWSGNPPIYRLYVNNQLFAERTYIWRGGYLTECFHVHAEPGDYVIRYETVTDSTASILIENLRITHGVDTAYIQDNMLRIIDETT
jgi:hypothetical protein